MWNAIDALHRSRTDVYRSRRLSCIYITVHMYLRKHDMALLITQKVNVPGFILPIYTYIPEHVHATL